MFRKLLTLAATTLLLTLPTFAHEKCSTLAIEIMPTPGKMFDTLSLTITGSAPDRPTWIVAGISNLPSTVNYGPHLTLNMDISVLVLNVYVGLTDGEGNYKRTYNLPRNIDLTLYAQAVTLDFERAPAGNLTFSFCTSNRVTVKL